MCLHKYSWEKDSNLNYLLCTNQLILSAFSCNFICKSKNVRQKEVVIQDKMVCAANGFQVPALLDLLPCVQCCICASF